VFESGQPIFNLGNPNNATTVWQLAERVVHLLDSSSTIEHRDATTIHGPHYEEAESFEKVPVLGAAGQVGWEPRLGLDELILETAEFYRANDDVRAGSDTVRPHVAPETVRQSTSAALSV
jgi:nucleoside-diphosphate-sugar epimerase